MLMVLLGAAIVLLLAGLGALGYGIQYKEFGFGNTLVVAGAVAACSGFLMFGFWAIARELQHVLRRLGSGTLQGTRPASPAESAFAPPLVSPPQPRPAAERAFEGSFTDAGVAPPWAEGRPDAPSPPPPAEGASQPKPRRNLLFTSTSRKERERAAARASEPLAPDLLSADLRPNPPAMDAPPVEPAPPVPPTFDDAWPKSDRARRAGRGPAPDVEPAPARDDKPQVSVLKSGMVDGMAYSLYSDGSIEAQMPEGMMRFASIDELRAHLDQRP
jgi:hypothetical protein